MWRTRLKHSSATGYAPPVPDRIVLIPGSGPLPASTPLLRADDAGVLYGDGVFETMHLRPSGPWLLDPHLARMGASAAQLDLPLPGLPTLRSLALAAAAAWPASEGALRLVCTRGPAGGPPTLYATVEAVPAAALRERHDGIRLITAEVGGRSPWSLSAAKTLAYAENLAARRWATTRGADDVLWVGPEGYVREAPTASVVWLSRDVLCTVPAQHTGILPGLTAAALLGEAKKVGLRPAHRLVTPDELADADAIWLASSLRGLAEATSLDGKPRSRSEWTPRLLQLLGF
ncbi:MAG: 4-amino-4-deoxychorismate lyase [Actinoplanes sp.]|nr:4-amino-4-deoxychorismate lyase [Actinoplanes sp.]